MKVLAVNWRDINNPEAGGAEVHLHEILAHLVRWGHEAVQLCAGWPGCSAEDTIDGIRILRRGHWYDANFALPLFAKKHLASDGYDVVLEDINKLPFFMPLVTDIPVVGVIPHLFGTTVFRETNFIIGSYVVMMERLISRIFKGNRFMVISQSTKDDLIERGITPDRIRIVLCGLDHNRYRNLNLERFDQPTIVHLGRLRKYKSVEVAIDAMRVVLDRFPSTRLVIVGDGPHRSALERKVGRMGLTGSVEFKGYMEHEELVTFLNRAHVLVNPSPKEGWGLTVVEANACGIPVVASDRPGLKDSVIDGRTGFLVPYGDVEAFAGKMIELLDDRDLWETMSGAALDRVKELTWERCARETLEFLEEIVG